jgi:hypothetical protein
MVQLLHCLTLSSLVMMQVEQSDKVEAEAEAGKLKST